MPEWPEMEHYRRMLNRHAAGRTIQGVEIQREKSINVDTATFTHRVQGKTLTEVDRRAKMLLLRLDSGDTLLLHLMLGGWMFFGTDEEKPDRTVQVTLRLVDGNLHGRNLYFIGLRLGYLHLFNEHELAQRLADLGPDPYDPLLTPGELERRLGKRHRTLKAALTDQAAIAGIGNCYSDEICWAARMKPGRAPSSLSSEEWHALHAAMRSTLRQALDYGGYMDQPFMPGDRVTGGYDSRCKVYDREGEPCERCGTLILREEVSGKKSFHCPGCQTQ